MSDLPREPAHSSIARISRSKGSAEPTVTNITGPLLYNEGRLAWQDLATVLTTSQHIVRPSRPTWTVAQRLLCYPPRRISLRRASPDESQYSQEQRRWR